VILSKILNIALIILVIGLVGNYVYRLPKFSNKQVAPTFNEVGLEGDTISFDSTNNSYVLLHFWATWCAPCMKKLPLLSKLYASQVDEFYQDSARFRIISIALDNNEVRLKEVIQKFGLSWSDHIMESNAFDGKLTKLYGVRKIPTMYLIGKDNKIILVNPDLSEITEFLQSQALKKS
jgi:thiol-disulfide isomerase/thioredoxin